MENNKIELSGENISEIILTSAKPNSDWVFIPYGKILSFIIVSGSAVVLHKRFSDLRTEQYNGYFEVNNSLNKVHTVDLSDCVAFEFRANSDGAIINYQTS